MTKQDEQALIEQLQPLLYELHRLYGEIPMHTHTTTDRVLAYGLLLLAEWSGSQRVPSLESERILIVARAFQAAYMQYKQDHPLVR
jgi:hypothetical protein